MAWLLAQIIYDNGEEYLVDDEEPFTDEGKAWRWIQDQLWERHATSSDQYFSYHGQIADADQCEDDEGVYYEVSSNAVVDIVHIEDARAYGG